MIRNMVAAQADLIERPRRSELFPDLSPANRPPVELTRVDRAMLFVGTIVFGVFRVIALIFRIIGRLIARLPVAFLWR